MMKLNLLYDNGNVDWHNINNNFSECLDKLQEVISQIQIDEDASVFHSPYFEDLWMDVFPNIYANPTLSWLLPYINPTGLLVQLYTQFPLTPNKSENIEALFKEFPNNCNGLLGCKNENKNLAYDLESYFALKNECESPKLRLGANQIQQLINTQYKHLFERIDTPTITEQGNLHGEQIQVHLNSGNTKNIGALNLDGTWKHPPDNRYLPIPNDVKKLLLEWGFKLPLE